MLNFPATPHAFMIWCWDTIHLYTPLRVQPHYRSNYRDDNSYCGLLGSDTCSSVSGNRRFRRTYCLNHHCQKRLDMVTSHRRVRRVNMGQSCGPT